MLVPVLPDCELDPLAPVFGLPLPVVLLPVPLLLPLWSMPLLLPVPTPVEDEPLTPEELPLVPEVSDEPLVEPVSLEPLMPLVEPDRSRDRSGDRPWLSLLFFAFLAFL